MMGNKINSTASVSSAGFDNLRQIFDNLTRNSFVGQQPAQSKPLEPASKPPRIPGSATVTIKKGDTPEKVAYRALVKAARQAGLPPGEQKRFAKKFADISLNWESGDPNTEDGSKTKSADYDKKVGGTVTINLSKDVFAELQNQRQDYISRGGKLSSNLEIASKPTVNEQQTAKTGIDNEARKRNELNRLADLAEVERTRFGIPANLDDLKHFSVSVAPDVKASDPDKILDALITKIYGDTIPFARNREDIRDIAKLSGVELKNVKVTNGTAEFDLTLESRLKLQIAHNGMRDGINRAESAADAAINKNVFSQFILGVFQGARTSIEGTAEAIADPVGTAKALWQVIGNPTATFNALYEELENTSDKFKAADYVERSRMIGQLLGTVITDILIGKGAGELGNILKATKTGAALMEKAEKLTVLSTAKVAETFSDEAAQLAKQRFANRLKELNLSPNSVTNIAADPELWGRATQVAGNTIGNRLHEVCRFLRAG